MGKPVIMCVDDEAIIVMSLIQELKIHLGDRYAYESALNAADALSLIDDLAAEGVSVILILSDWLMPGMKGDDFLIKVHQEQPDIRCILITGQADTSVKERVIAEANACTVLGKPWKTDELIRAVDDCCC